MIKKISHWYLAINLAVIILGGGLLAYWLLYPYEVFRFNTEKNRIVTPVVRAGENVAWEIDVEHLTQNVRVETHFQLINGYIIDFVPASYITSKGHLKTTRFVKIPEYAPAGKYHIEIHNFVHINPIRSLTIIRQTEDFQIIK